MGSLIRPTICAKEPGKLEAGENMKSNVRLNSFLTVALVLAGCSPALPRPAGEPDSGVPGSVASASSSSGQVQEALTLSRLNTEKAVKERERAEEILKEVKALSERAEKAKVRCETLAKQAKQRKIIKAPEAPLPTAHVEPPHVETPKAEPDHSPSDSPQ